LLLEEGRYAEALAALDAGLDEHRIPNPAWHPWRTLRARALAGLGREDEARELLAEELRLARRWGAPTCTGRVLRVLGELTADEEVLREAITVLEPTSAAVERARAQLALARLPSVTQPEAVELMRAVRDAGHVCGAVGLRDAAQAALRELGDDEPERVAEQVVLTTTERRVLDLMEAGFDAREVAQRLFLTPGTVQSIVDGLDDLVGGLK
jgi:ATP/maltotriose-dependent transcriptional regulator MalT